MIEIFVLLSKECDWNEEVAEPRWEQECVSLGSLQFENEQNWAIGKL